MLRSNAEQAPDVVMIGNSITHYWGGEPKAHAARGEKAWRELFRGQEVRNMGFGWDRIENGLWRIYHGELDGYSADKVFLLLGTNNLSTDTDRDIITGIGQLLRAVRERQPRAKVYVCGIMPRQGMEPRIAALNRELRTSLPKGEATYVDLTSLLVDESGCILPGLFLDGLHPNEAGYERVARMLKPFVRE